MTTLEILQSARDLISDKSSWTQKEFARKSDGSHTVANAPDAVCWCAIGALCKVTDFGEIYSAITELENHNPHPRHTIAYINDEEGHEAILALFDNAIKAEKAKQKLLDTQTIR